VQTVLSLEKQWICVGHQLIEVPAVDVAPPVAQTEFSLDDVFGPLEAAAGEAAVAEATRSIADLLYPEHSDTPTLAVLRLRAGMSQRKLADAMGIKQPQIARLEAGKDNPTFTTLQKLAKALNLSTPVVAAALETTLETAQHA
jgi:DNA-binding XRE family transcriptional regulator